MYILLKRSKLALCVGPAKEGADLVIALTKPWPRASTSLGQKPKPEGGNHEIEADQSGPAFKPDAGRGSGPGPRKPRLLRPRLWPLAGASPPRSAQSGLCGSRPKPG